MDKQPTIGQRLRTLRSERGLTQEELAEAAGVSLDLVKKLEQGQRQSARLTSLIALANALDVTLAQLTDRRPRLDGGTARLVLGVRDVLLQPGLLPGVDLGAEHPPTGADVAALLRRGWAEYWAGRFADLAADVPGIITEARAATIADGREASARLAQAYQLTACLLVQLGRDELAATAAERGLTAATASGDELQWATICGTYCWVLLCQGRPDEAHRFAVRVAEQIQPRRPDAAAQPHLTVWGGLLLWGLAGAVSGPDTDTVPDLIEQAAAIAVHMPRDRHDYEVNFGPSQVAMQTTYAYANLGDTGRALDAARRVDRADLLGISYGRHLLDVAVAQAGARRDDAAVRALSEAASLAPVWFRHQGVARSLVGEIRGRHVRPSSALRGLVATLGNAAEHNTRHI